jgi:hypothetical protein
MSETTQATVTEQPSAVSANWDALKDIDVVVETTTVKEESNPQNTDVQPDAKVEDVKTETEPKAEEPKEAEKAEETKEESKEEEPKAPSFELKAEDIKDVPQTYEEGDWRAVAQDLGVSIKENSWEEFQNTFKEQFVPKSEFEKVEKLSREKILSEFSPEVAAAIELANLGVPQDLIFEPTKQIDGWLALDSSALVREDLKARGYSDDVIDAKIEKLIEDDKLERDASLIREELKIAREQTLQQRTQIVQQKTEEKQRVQQQLKEQEFTQLTKALDNKQEFMGTQLSKEVKEAILKKAQTGAYDSVLSDPSFKVEAILYKEYGQKMTEYIKTKAFSEGKLTEVKKLSNIPPVESKTAGGVEQPKSSDNWAALKGAF